MKLIRFFCLTILIFISVSVSSFAQETLAQDENLKPTLVPVVIDYNNPKSYTVAGISVTGIKYLNEQQIISYIGINVGDVVTLPSEDMSSLVNMLWAQSFVSDVALYASVDPSEPDKVYLELAMQERPRVSQWKFTGVKSSERTDITERLKLKRGNTLSDFLISASVDIIKRYYKEKGFLECRVNVTQVNDPNVTNAVQVTFNVKRGQKIKVKKITFEGNTDIPSSKLAAAMKTTKDSRLVNFFKSKKFNEEEYENDKELLIKAMQRYGYRDARIVSDSIYKMPDDPSRLGIHFVVDQGKKYYFRNIVWTGNSVYSSENLNKVIVLKSGDVYDMVSLENRLYGGGKMGEMNVSQLYRDQGYLFFNVIPVETNIVKDSVDMEIRVVEGKPATFNNIEINGNTTTNERVIRRALFTKPGYLFSQSDLERSIREISSLGFFNAESIVQQGSGWNMIPDPMTNTVDVVYNVEEVSNSKFNIAGGWGGNTFVFQAGISFNNFSMRRLFKKNAWRPVPLGDGQSLSLNVQTNGTYYTAVSAGFTEPWLFGKKPTSFNVSAYYAKQTDSYYWQLSNDKSMEVFGVSIGLGTRLKWPDNYFVLYNELNWQTYKLRDWDYNFLFKTGLSHNLSYRVTLSRNSTDQMFYPRKGSDLTLGLQITPPYSLFRDKNTDYKNMSDEEKYRWIEYHKWTFKGKFYTKIVGDLVLMARIQFGYLGYYNRNLGYSPFEGFKLGGDGMTGYDSYGSEIVSMRGYTNYSLTPIYNDAYAGNVYDKFSLELRYPIMLQPSASIYAFVFAEAGNAWSDIRDFNPFSVKRSAGVGVRLYLPIVGILGVDWGYGFDKDFLGNKGGSQFHFVIGQEF